MKKLWLKEKDSITIMSFELSDNENNIDEHWRGRSEVQSTWEKKYIVKMNPKTSSGGKLFDLPCIMKFRYIEDYEKMKKLDEKIGKIIRNMDNDNVKQEYKNYFQAKDFVYELYHETKDLEEFVKECYFFNVDYDHGIFYLIKFCNIIAFLANGDCVYEFFNYLLFRLEHSCYVDLYEYLEKDICPALIKIYGELLQRGLLNLE